MERTLLPAFLSGGTRDLLRESVGGFLEEVMPWERVRELDAEDRFPRDVWEGLGALGVLGIGIPPGLGGGGGTAADAVVVCAEIAARYPSLAVDYVLVGMVARMLADHGTDEQRQRWLPGLSAGTSVQAYGISEPDGGTDALALRTRAHLDDGTWIVNGSKLWISMADESDVIFVLLRTDEPNPPDRRALGVSVLAVPTDQPGVQVRRVHLAGMRGAGTCEVTFDGARAPEDWLIGPRGRGFHMLRETLDVERLLSAAISIGIGRAALAATITYARAREAFGRPIGGFQALQHAIVDASLGLAGAMLITEQAVAAHEAESEASDVCGMAKLATAEATAVVVDRGMRVMAGMGLARETPMQMWFRDARLQLFSPLSNDMIRNILGESLGLPRSY
jgi:alkylation response protein AidB-like acyl-CoA dehydrogenase